jgi:serine/threonine-protein kinase HipA
METAQSLQVLLHDQHIGSLSLGHGAMVEFRLLESYKQAYPRQVLGQQFLDDLNKVHRSRARVPTWFSNLLPEGVLRELIARQAGVASAREYFLLAHLGEDLPGAVRIVAASDVVSSEPLVEEQAVLAQETDALWHFSLAGVQLKFSATRVGRGLTIPVSGRGGDWIVKLPDIRYAGVPENEFATMQWARASGIETPDFELIALADVEGLPPEYSELLEQQAFVVKRFDRPGFGERMHMEDFAQVLDVYPEQKYDKANYETLAKVIHALTGQAGLEDFLRRLVFMLASGNGDAHLKNWSLLYPDGFRPRLTPAYDLVSTIQYMHDDRLALNLGKSKRWGDIDLEKFRRMSRRIDFPEARMVEIVQACVDAVQSAWQSRQGDFGYDMASRTRLQRHMAGVPLLS